MSNETIKTTEQMSMYHIFPCIAKFSYDWCTVVHEQEDVNQGLIKLELFYLGLRFVSVFCDCAMLTWK